MAIEWHYLNDYLAVGLDWSWTADEEAVRTRMSVYRWDRYATDNYAGTWSEALSPDPEGAGSWGGLGWPASDASNQTRVCDTFVERTYLRTHSEQTVRYSMSWQNIGTWYGGSFQSLGDGSAEWELNVSALPSYTVSFDANGGSGAPAAAVKWHGEPMTLPSAAPTRAHHTFAGWATSSNADAADYPAGGTYAADASVTLYAVWRIVAPSAPAGCTAVRRSDFRADVSWTPGPDASATYGSVLVERSIDGAAWSQVASASGAATSWSDAGLQPNHAYRYRVRAGNATGHSAYAAAPETLYTTPAAPVSVTAARTGEASVALTIANPANTATALQYEYAATTAGAGTVVTVQGERVTSATARPGGGTWYFRARNTRGDLASEWSPWSEPVVTVCPPAAPTLTAPAQGSVVKMGDASALRFAWAHNAPDGSAQTAAEVRWRAGSASWSTLTAAAEQRLTADVSDAGLNASVEWQARTKGAHEDFGPWSAVSSFRICQVPSVAFAAPADGAVIEGTPISVQLAYEDASGELASCMLMVVDSMGAQAYALDMGSAASASIASSDWLPENGGTYTFRASVRSTSGLSASADREASVSFVEPQGAVLELAPDASTGIMGIQVALEPLGGLQPAVSAAVWRVNPDGTRKLLADRLAEGAYFEDRYAPLNVPYAYEGVTQADSGAVRKLRFDAVLESRRAFLIGSHATACGELAPTLDDSYDRPRRKLVVYEGRGKPVLYDSVQQGRKLSFGCKVVGREELDAFRAIMEEGACVFKSHVGDVLHVACDVSIGRSPLVMGGAADVSVSMTEVDGDAL